MENTPGNKPRPSAERWAATPNTLVNLEKLWLGNSDVFLCPFKDAKETVEGVTDIHDAEWKQRAISSILGGLDGEKRLDGTDMPVIICPVPRAEETQRAFLNILDDFDSEKHNLERTQKATVNILEDFNTEKARLEDTQRALLNILDDSDAEKGQLETVQRATFNILEDFNSEKLRLEDTQRAVLNILEDFDIEKTRVSQANLMLQAKSEELNRANEELQRARDTLEIRVAKRTAELQERTLELEASNRSLEASNRELESFSYSVSHDLRAPLRSMDGFSLALMEDYGDKLDAQANVYLQFIRSSSQMMGQLIDDILNLSRITRAEIHLDKVDLSGLAQEVADELKRSQPERSVDFIIAPRLEAYGDKSLLKLVLQNLLGNAFKFTRKQPEARIEFGAINRDGEIAYVIRDNGVGFDMLYVHKLFKPFQRLHRPDEFSGTGIGLASVQRIINRLGGRVWAEGETDNGAAFYFTLREP